MAHDAAIANWRNLGDLQLFFVNTLTNFIQRTTIRSRGNRQVGQFHLLIMINKRQCHLLNYREFPRKLSDSSQIGFCRSLFMLCRNGGCLRARQALIETALRPYLRAEISCKRRLPWVMNGELPIAATGFGGRQSRTDRKYGNIWDNFTVVYE